MLTRRSLAFGVEPGSVGTDHGVATRPLTNGKSFAERSFALIDSDVSGHSEFGISADRTATDVTVQGRPRPTFRIYHISLYRW